jgi:hypothetical protein
VGDDDVSSETVGVNARGSDRPDRGIAVGDFITQVVAEVEAKKSPESALPPPVADGSAR